ncbi:WD repeat-containing protein 75, partial [Bienertia sinuspersici]
MIYGGKSFVSSRPTFSNDAKRLLICTGNSVSIFSTSTGLQITELEGHRSLVTSVVVVPSSSKVLCYCWTSSLDGTIRYWDFSVPELIKTIDICLPIFSMVIPNILSKQEGEGGKAASVFAYISVEDMSDSGDRPKRLHGQIRKCNLTKSKLVSAVTLKETVQPEFITISPSGEYFGIRNKRALYMWKVPADDSDRSSMKKMKMHHTKNFTTFAFHPNDSILAAGDVSGRILLWRGFNMRTHLESSEQARKLTKHEDERAGVREKNDVESCSTWHWHSSEVKFLAFSSDGAYLYS